MKRHRFTPGDLQNNPEFVLIASVGYDDLKPFIIHQVQQKNWITVVFSVVQIMALAAAVGIISFYAIGFILNGLFLRELISAGVALVFSFTFLIVIHELIHAAAFRLLGKKDIGFGVQWEKYLFYTETNREVLNRVEMNIVALAPLIVITLTGLGLFLFAAPGVISLAGLMVALTHMFFCGGDMAIIAFLEQQKPNEVYTFDDRNEKRSYYFTKANIN